MTEILKVLNKEKKRKVRVSIQDLEDEINRLESIRNTIATHSASLEDNTSNKDSYDGACSFQRDDSGNILSIKSSLLIDSKIEPLPISVLPSKRCITSLNTSQRKPRNSDIKPEKSSSSRNEFHRTVKKMIDSYIPSASVKKPFYCRTCLFQGNNLDEYQEHMQCAAHEQNIKLEKRVCFCKLCCKQFTSPAQLDEHLKGKVHRERLQLLRKNVAR